MYPLQYTQGINNQNNGQKHTPESNAVALTLIHCSFFIFLHILIDWIRLFPLEFCQSENAGDDVALLLGGPEPELQ